MDGPERKPTENHVTRSRFSFCLPFPTGARGIKGQDSQVPLIHLFPEIEDLNRAYTLLPIKTYWFPSTRDDMWFTSIAIEPKTTITTSVHHNFQLDAYYCHESLHLFLSDTPLSLYTFLLIQYQYVALFHSSVTEQKIHIPSLDEPLKFIATAQAALEKIISPMVFYHELAATTATRFFAQKGKRCLTTNLWLKILTDVLEKQIDGYSSDYMHGLIFIPAPGLPKHDIYARWLNHVTEKDWLRFYEEDEIEFENYSRIQFNKSFRQLHHKLLNAWHKIANNIAEHEWPQIIVSLLRYPFETSAIPELDLARDPQAALTKITQAVTERANDPIKKLRILLKVVSDAPEGLDANAWRAYLREQLPDLVEVQSKLNGQLVSLQDEPTLALYTKQLWHAFNYPKVGDLFHILYTPISNELIYIDRYPVVNDDVLPPAHLRPNLLVYQIPLLLESMRQSLLCGKGVTCLCAPHYQASCKVKAILSQFGKLVTPDRGEEWWFNQACDWRKPVCSLDSVSAARRIKIILAILHENEKIISYLKKQWKKKPDENLPPDNFNLFDIVSEDELVDPHIIGFDNDGAPVFEISLQIDMMRLYGKIDREVRIQTNPNMFNRFWLKHQEEYLKAAIRLGSPLSSIW